MCDDEISLDLTLITEKIVLNDPGMLHNVSHLWLIVSKRGTGYETIKQLFQIQKVTLVLIKHQHIKSYSYNIIFLQHADGHGSRAGTRPPTSLL